MAILDFELEREGNAAVFMNRINGNPKDYASKGLELVKNLNFNPMSSAYSYVFRFLDSTLFIEDKPWRERSYIRVSSENPEKTKSQLLNIVNNEAISGAKR